MEATQTWPRPEEHFYASKKSSINRARLGLWGGAAIGIALFTAAQKSGFSWIATLLYLSFVALLDWFFRRQMRNGQVLASVDDGGITSPAFSGAIKRFEWQDVAEVKLTRVQSTPVLQLVLKTSQARPDKRDFWTGQNKARPVLTLAALDQATQEQLFDSIQTRLPSNAMGVMSPKLDNQLQQERAFQDRLKSFAPVPWLTYGLIAINAVIWLASLVYGADVSASPTDLLLRWGGNAASEVQRGEWWRLVSAMFLHSGLLHLALNMFGLYFAGVTVERIYGHRLFALIYLGSGLVGGALSLHFSAQTGVSVGASGAVFGVTGALLIAMVLQRKHLPKSLGKQTLWSLGFFILYSLAQGFSKPNVDNAAHVGGLLAGCLLAYLLPKHFDMNAFVQQYKPRALMGLLITAGLTAGLSGAAPTAQIDQRAGLLIVEGMRKLHDAGQAMQREAELVKMGKMSELESDERSRTVFAPMVRDALMVLNKAELPISDPRHAQLTGAKRLSTLTLEALEMDSVHPDGHNKPEPVNPQRMAEINEEIQMVSKQMIALNAKLANNKSP
jgi:rhomboid protease GluP